MVEINYQNLPAPMGFKIDMDSLNLWDYVPDPESHDGPTPRLNYAFRSGSMDALLVTLPPGAKLPWHTHEPHTSQVYWVLDGEIKTNYKDNDGEIHSTEGNASDEELIYLPAGAHNQLENTGEETARLLSFKEGGGSIVGRLEHLMGDTDEHYDPKTIPSAGLDLLPRRGKVLDSQSDAIEEW